MTTPLFQKTESASRKSGQKERGERNLKNEGRRTSLRSLRSAAGQLAFPVTIEGFLKTLLDTAFRQIDGLFLGPSDLSIALSDGKTLDPQSKDVERELDRIVAATRRAGKIAGAYCHTPERALALRERGVRFLAVMSDLAILRAGIAAAMKVLKG